jgi:high affinity sulfate transporter 1
MFEYIFFLNNLKNIRNEIIYNFLLDLEIKKIFIFKKSSTIKNVYFFIKAFFVNLFHDIENFFANDILNFFFFNYLSEEIKQQFMDELKFLNESLIDLDNLKLIKNLFLKNWSETSFQQQTQYQKKINKNLYKIENHFKILISRCELFNLVNKELEFDSNEKFFWINGENENNFHLFEKLIKNEINILSYDFPTDAFESIFFFLDDENRILENNEINFFKSILSQKKKFFQPFFLKPKLYEEKNFSTSLILSLYNFFPILTWFPKYNWKSYLKKDIVAGITVGVMLIAQGMAYAKLAGLSPEYGLYSSGLPLFIYPLFGTSRHLGFGPVALISLLVSQVTLSVNNAGHDYSQNEKTAFALLISFCVGLTQIFMGMIKIGFIINFISHPVIAGFTSAAALVIILSQLQYLLGYTVNKSYYPFLTLYNYINNINKFRWQPFFFGLLNILFMQFIKWVNKRYKYELPGPIICVFFSILITKILKLNRFGISIQNKIPKGFPVIKGPIFNEFSKVAPTVLTISFINFLETIAIASKIGEMQGYKIVPDQELLGSGVTNFLGSFIGAFPMAGSFSRTAVLSQAGAQTQIAGMITGLLIILTYTFFTPVFTYLPNVTLASIILVSVINLIDYKEAIHLFHLRVLDFFAFMISLISTFIFGVEWGIIIAVAVSLFFVLWFSIKPPTSILGRIPGTVIYKNIKLYYTCTKTPGGILFRMDGPLFFLNSSILRGKIFRKEEKYKYEHPVSLFYIILDCRGMTDIDSTGLQVLSEIGEKLNKQGVFMGFSNVNERVLNLIKAGDLNTNVYSENFFTKIHDGVEAAIRWKYFHLKRLKKKILLKKLLLD